MDIRKHANTLLALLAEKLKGEIAPLDESDVSIFSIDGIMVTASFADEVDTLVVTALIGRLPKNQGREAALRELARGNFHWGGTDGGIIGLEENTDLVFLHKKFDLPLAEAADFPAAMVRQIGLVKYWAKTLTRDDTAISPSALRV